MARKSSKVQTTTTSRARRDAWQLKQRVELYARQYQWDRAAARARRVDEVRSLTAGLGSDGLPMRRQELRSSRADEVLCCGGKELVGK